MLRSLALLIALIAFPAHAQSSAQCLATVIYFEARGESQMSQIAVAYAAVNRARSRNRTVCASLNRNSYPWFGLQPQDARALANVCKVANQVLSRLVADPTYGATHFHNGTVHPSWANRLHRTTRVGAHYFYTESELKY